jgi:hypothetical protein
MHTNAHAALCDPLEEAWSKYGRIKSEHNPQRTLTPENGVSQPLMAEWRGGSHRQALATARTDTLGAVTMVG